MKGTTGLSKRNGAKLRESFCPAAAGHARLVLSTTVPFFCTSLYVFGCINFNMLTCSKVRLKRVL